MRRSRPRFWDGDPAAFGTLHRCLVGVAQLLAPFSPFVADEIYDNLDGAEPSVHLCDFPEVGERDAEPRVRDGVVRETVRLGLAARGQAKLKVRQPLRAAVVVAAGAERVGDRAARGHRARRAQRQGSCATSRRPTSSAPTRSSPTTARSGRASASTCRRWRPRSPRSIPRTSPTRCATTGRVGVNVDGHDHELGADDLLLAMRPLEGYQLEREGSHAVALELELDDELRREGLAREIVHAVQNARKTAGLEVEDRIELTLGGDDELLDAARAHEPYLTGETLAVAVTYDGASAGEEATVKGRPLLIAVRRSGV